MLNSYKKLSFFVFVVVFSAISNSLAATLEPDAPIDCHLCEAWNRPQEPFRIFGNTYYVGTAGLTSILIQSDDGLILIDGALPQSAEQIAGNIVKLGFKVEDIRLILNSHTHYDHAGGIAALQRASGAAVVASPSSKQALTSGKPVSDDPQHGFEPHNFFPPVKNVQEIKDSQPLTLGSFAINAQFTPGHTPGSTTWSWRSCEKDSCLDIVYADSLNAVSAPDFRFTGDVNHPSRIGLFNESIDKVENLPCDILITPHPVSFDMYAKLKKLQQDSKINPFIDANACKAYAAMERVKLQQRVEGENTKAEDN